MNENNNRFKSILDMYQFPDELKMTKQTFEWLMHSEEKTHPTAALTTVITVAATIAARTYWGPTNISSTLYIILLAETGSGKNIVIKKPSDLLLHKNIEHHITTSKINSLGALDDIFCSMPILTQIMDEFGDQLGHMLNDRGGNYSALRDKIKNLYGLTNGFYETNHYSSSGGRARVREATKIERPCYSLVGVTTKTQLLQNLNDSMMHDGFINRFIILNGMDIPSYFPENIEYKIPNNILEHIASIKVNDYYKSDEYKRLNFSNDAKVYYNQYIGDADLPETDIYNYCKEELEFGRAISVRWRENALRMATALCVYENKKEITLPILQWCYELIKTSSIAFLDMFEEEASQTKYQLQKQKAIQWFKRNGVGNYVSASELARNVRPFKGMSSRERKELLEDLVESNIIDKKEETIERTKKTSYAFLTS